MIRLGDLPVDGTAYCEFDTFDSDGASVTITGLVVTDIEIYKDGGTTTRASDNGYSLIDTDGIDVNGHAGCHGFSVDLSDNSDAGFYATGSHFRAIVDAITVDGQTVRFSFSWTIGRLLRPATAGRTLAVSANGEANADLTFIHGTALTETSGRLAGRFVDFFNQAAAGYSVATALASFKATGFSTHNAAAVVTAMETDGSKLDHLWEMTEDDSGTRRLTTNALEQGPDSDTTANLTLHSDYDAAKTANSVVPDAAGVVATALGALETHGDSTWATAAGFSTHSAANVWAVGTRVLTAGTNLNDLNATAVAAAVWDALYASYADASSFGILIGAAFEEV